MKLDGEAVKAWIRQAGTEELLDRATVYRDDMEPEAVDWIAAELARRDVSAEQMREHVQANLERQIVRRDGSVARCWFCQRPAAKRAWRLRSRVVPLRIYVCTEH